MSVPRLSRLVAGQIATAIASARALEEAQGARRGAGRDRSRQDRLLQQRQPRVPHAADADARAASRTRWRRRRERCAAASDLETVHRNGLRLLKLVNTLLDFSRIEAGRVQAPYEPADLAALHARPGERVPVGDRARRPALRRSTARRSRAGLRRSRDVGEDRPQSALERVQVHVRRARSVIALDGGGEHVELRSATPASASPTQIPRTVRRFHRVEDAKARTHEGTESGWRWCRSWSSSTAAPIAASSELGEGHDLHGHASTRRRAHLPADHVVRERAGASASAPRRPTSRRRCAGCPRGGRRAASRRRPTQRPPARDPRRGRQRRHARLRRRGCWRRAGTSRPSATALAALDAARHGDRISSSPT